MNDSVHVVVNGIMRDIKNSAIPSCDILFRMDNIKYFNPGMDSYEFDNAGSALIFILEKGHADLHAKADDMADYFREIFWLYQRNIYSNVLFLPLKDVYFSKLNNSGYLLRNGDSQFVVILLSIGILILIFAIINYINLTVAQTGFRAKEMATRRLLGSSRKELFLRLILESTLLTFVSFVIGFFLARLCLPFANNLLETRIYFFDAITWQSVLISFCLIVGIGCFAGLLPAFIISNSKPVDVVKGTFRQKTKMVFSKIFITFQNVITITLLAVSLTMILQINHLIKAPLGYNTVNIIDIPTWPLEGDEQVRLLCNELEQLALVKRVAYARGTPFDRGNNYTVVYNGKNISFQALVGDSAYFHMLGFEILMDNNLGNSDGYYLNEQSFLELEIADDAPSILIGEDWNLTIAGKVKDFQLRNISYNKNPVLLQLKKVEDFSWRIWNILVEVQGDPGTAYSQVKDVYERICRLNFDGKFIDQQITESFAVQKRTSTIMMVFTFVAILISLLGLLAMSTYFVQQRSKEIAVRKVFGSDNQQILMKLVGTFLNYVLIAFVLAIPVIYYFMTKWLQEYTYRISLSPWIFMAAGLFCFFISFLTVFWQSRRAAHSNPVDSLKAE
ncbi:MAG: ABC transporter permease [Tannerellaceae bacterium]|nr:ABC transporter permease [Tannerellaceae bacterium]